MARDAIRSLKKRGRLEFKLWECTLKGQSSLYHFPKCKLLPLRGLQDTSKGIISYKVGSVTQVIRLSGSIHAGLAHTESMQPACDWLPALAG